MKKPNLKNMLMSELEPHLAKEGFKFEKSMLWYTKKKNDISDYFFLEFYTAREGFRVQPALRVRSETMDRIYHQASWIKPAEQKRHTAVAFTMWRVFGGDQKKFECSLASEDSVKPCTEKLMGVFREFAVSFFDKCSSIAAINELFGDPSDSARQVYLLDPFEHGVYATIAAKLAANARYSTIAEHYLSYIKSHYPQGPYIETYEKLLQVLENEKAAGAT
jgi:hypothetical protein